MITVLFVLTTSVVGDQPTSWLKQRLDTAIDYFSSHSSETCVFVVSGRWNNVTQSYPVSESEVCRRYLLSRIPTARILTEDIAVETGGGLAFAKPLITSLHPDKVLIYNSAVNAKRTRYLAKKLFDPTWKLEFIFIDDSFSQNPRAHRKEPKALVMFKKLFDHLQDGDDQQAREILLYKTPFYHKGLIDDKEFFDHYWPGGYDDFLEKRLSINNQ